MSSEKMIEEIWSRAIKAPNCQEVSQDEIVLVIEIEE
jgi:hypothetical protein